MTIYLYVKTHRKTGLKYLGKTESKDPHKYHGSGKYWKRHLRVYGYEVDTEILRECNSDEEIREWGLYYSELWQVVESDKWANLKEEAGDGFTGEQARRTNLKRVEDGTHNWLGDENNRQRVEDGTHHFLCGEVQRQTNLKRVEDGTHNFLGGEVQRQNALKRIADGTHNLLGGELQRQTQQKRVEDGTHNFLGGEMVRRRVADGTHHFQTTWTCAHCGKRGKGTGMFTRWHGDKCKQK
jgi:hypothetical protein